MNKKYLHQSGRPYTKPEFLKKLKNDNEFNQKFGSKKGIDQIQNLINLLKTNPDSRRLLVSSWSVNDVEYVVLPPCHYSFQCYTTIMTSKERYDRWVKYRKDSKLNDSGMSDEKAMEYYDFPTRKLSLKFNMRSTDIGLGFPFNIASYAMLLNILSIECNMVSDEIICSMGDAHIYINHVNGINEQLIREPFELPKLIINEKNDIDKYEIDDFEIIDYKYHPSIKLPLSN